MKAPIQFLFLLCLLGLSISPTIAAESAPKPVTTEDTEIPVPFLKLKLEPLTVQELEVEVTAWHGLVKEISHTVSDAAIETQKAEEGSEEKKTSFDKMEAAQKTQTALIERLEAVLAAWEAKGGDPSEHHLYLKALKGIKVNLTDASSLAELVKRWTVSSDGGLKMGIKLLIFLGIMLVTWVVAGIVARIVRTAMHHHEGSSELLDNFVNKITRRIVLAIGLLIGLSTLGVNVSALLALMGGSAFILGFAMQDTLSNFANGIMLLLYRPFDVGDFVEVAGVSGTVRSVSLVSTEITTPDNKVILIPNKQTWGQTITNATRSDTRRVDLVFGISYDDDAAKAADVLLKVVSEHELVLKTPEPNIKLHELADSSVNLICRPWTKTEDYWTVYWDLMKRVKEAFDAEGLNFPYPTRDVFVHQSGDQDAS